MVQLVKKFDSHACVRAVLRCRKLPGAQELDVGGPCCHNVLAAAEVNIHLVNAVRVQGYKALLRGLAPPARRAVRVPQLDAEAQRRERFFDKTGVGKKL